MTLDVEPTTGLRPKNVSLEEAAGLIRDGVLLGFQSPSLELAPMALLREAMRRGLRRVSLVGVPGGGINMDLLIGAGLVEHAQICNLDMGSYGAAPNFKRWAEAGRLKVLDST